MNPSTFSMCSWEMSAPTWVAGSSGSPILMAFTRARSRSMKALSRLLCTKKRRAVGAHLAGGVEIAEQRAGDGIVELRVLEDDERGLAAELERHLLEGTRRV